MALVPEPENTRADIGREAPLVADGIVALLRSGVTTDIFLNFDGEAGARDMASLLGDVFDSVDPPEVDYVGAIHTHPALHEYTLEVLGIRGSDVVIHFRWT